MIIVMGLPGAGKTTVLQGLHGDYKILNYGDLMLEIEKEKFGVKDRDEMRKLPIEKQKEAQMLVAEKLSKMNEKIILDTHCSINTPSGYYPGLPFDFLKKLKVEKLIYITAPADQIYVRRNSDPTRKRDAQTLEEILEHDNINKSYLAAYSAFTGAPAAILINAQGKLEETRAKLNSLL
ncbi:MAG: adenylate kinase [Candidatus Bilamarchaeaceae archaeon]